MKTIAYKDRAGGPLKEFVSRTQNELFGRENSEKRIKRALTELRHVGNINIYIVRGRKTRKIATHLL